MDSPFKQTFAGFFVALSRGLTTLQPHNGFTLFGTGIYRTKIYYHYNIQVLAIAHFSCEHGFKMWLKNPI